MDEQLSRRSFLSASAMGAGALAGFGKDLQNAVERANLSSRPSDLEITDIRCGFLGNGDPLFVKIYTNQDIVGHGEAVDAVQGTYQLIRSFGWRLRGENPLDVHRLFYEIRRGGVFAGAQAGKYVAALSAVETALWDLAGKALGVPVYQLLGGKFRDKIRVYVDSGSPSAEGAVPTPEDFSQAAVERKEEGYTAIKFDIDERNDPARYDEYNWTASPGELQRIHDTVAAAREAVGPEIDICVDGHGRYDLPTGKKIAQILEPYDLMWLEEPIPAENPEAYKLINESSNIPICAGENHFLAHGLRPLLEIGAVDIVMPDLQKAGGLGEGQRIANLASLYYVPFSPHMVASFLGAMASCHVCASVPNFMILEWQTYFDSDPMWSEIVDFEGPMIEDGFIPLSNKPGIGVEINEEGLRPYAQEGVPFFEPMLE